MCRILGFDTAGVSNNFFLSSYLSLDFSFFTFRLYRIYGNSRAITWPLACQELLDFKKKPNIRTSVAAWPIAHGNNLTKKKSHTQRLYHV